MLGALTLIGTLALTSAFLFAAWRDGSPANLRLALRSLTLGVIPSWLFLRVGAEWLADKEGYADLDKPPAWIDIGYIVGDLSFLLIVITSLLGWFTLRRTRAGGTAEPSQAARDRVGPDRPAARPQPRGALGDDDEARLSARASRVPRGRTCRRRG